MFEDQFDGEWDRGWYLFDEMFPGCGPGAHLPRRSPAAGAARLAHRQVYLTAADAKDFYGLPARDVAAAMEELARQGIPVRWREGYLPAQDVPLLQAQVFERCAACWRCTGTTRWSAAGKAHESERYKSPEKGSEVTQYLFWWTA